MGKGGGGGATQNVTEYRASIHYGICQGPVDALTEVKVNEKVAFQGAVVGQEQVRVNKQNLFGGIKKEGGLFGDLYFQPGNFTQLLDAFVASKYGATPTTLPGYRGIATAFFTNTVGNAYNGFYWSANQPFIPPAWFKVTRVPRAWYPETAAIPARSNLKRALYISIDDSGSMAGTRLATMKSAMDAVFDRLSSAITALGLDIDIGVQRWGATSSSQIFRGATAANVEALRTFVDGFDASLGGTDFDEAAQGAVSFFGVNSGVDMDNRTWIFITDGVSDPAGSQTTAAATAADLLDKSSGTFSNAAGNQVDCYGINIELTDTSQTALLDNTPGDSVPVVSSTDPSGLARAVQTAVFAAGSDANPIHMIYECLTDRVWGMGASTTAVDDASFRAAALTLFNEGFGLSMIWTQQASIEEFIQEILDHIEANLFVDPADGLFKIKLIRGDYVAADLPLYDESLMVVKTYQIRSPAEIVNELNVTWTDPDNEQDSVYTVHDLGGIVINGGEIKSDNRNYYGIRSAELAAEVAARDIATLTAPLATAEIEVNRVGWDRVPGDVIRFTSREHGAVEKIMRVVKINYGEPRDPTIEVSLTEDIFTFDRPVLQTPPTTLFVDPGQAATAPETTTIFTLNYFLTGYLVDAVSTFGADYPDVYLGLMPSSENTDTQDVEIYGPRIDPAGNVTEQPLGTRSIIARGGLPSAWTQEAVTTSNAFTDLTVGEGPVAGGFGLVGTDSDTEATMELVLFKSFDGTTWTIARGVLDTVPRAWPSGTPIRFFSADTFIEDNTARSAFETVSYTPLTRTSVNLLDFADAAAVDHTATERPHLPSRPANVKINDVAWSEINAEGLTSIPVTWANRNRVTEDSQILDWDAATVAAETGQSVRIKIYSYPANVLVNTIDVTTQDATSHSLALSDFMGESAARVEILAVLSDRESLQYYEQVVLLSTGYGYSYGLNYGGA